MKLSGLVKDSQVTMVTGAVTIFGDPGAVLSRSNDGPILQVTGAGVDVRIIGLEISGSTDAALGADAIDFAPSDAASRLTLAEVRILGNQGGGINATGGTLIVSRSQISDNANGGIKISGSQFSITNSFIIGNGNSNSIAGGSAFGGVTIDEATTDTVTGLYQFDFNTVVGNLGTQSVVLGVACSRFLKPHTFVSNIVFDNVNAQDPSPAQFGSDPNCKASYSDIGTTVQVNARSTAFTGMGNLLVVPMFANAVKGDYHLMPGSPLKRMADPNATIPDDIDGDRRPQHVLRDIGADEIPLPN